MKKRLIPLVILIAYSAILINVLVFKNLPAIRVGYITFQFGGTHEGSPNFIPFKTILPYLLGESGFIIAFLNIAGNIILLVPAGFIIPFIYRDVTWKKMLMVAIASGLAIEGLQALLRIGIFDVDDVILNGLGVIIGFWAFTRVTQLRLKRYKAIIITTVIVFTAVVAFCGVAVYRNSRQPMRLAGKLDNMQPGNFDSAANTKPVDNDSVNTGTVQLPDPCGGTGGTGQIVSVGQHAIIIKGHNGLDQLIKIGAKTKIKNAAGTVAEADLKPGQKVTVVIGLDPADDKLASAIMVCNQ